MHLFFFVIIFFGKSVAVIKLRGADFFDQRWFLHDFHATRAVTHHTALHVMIAFTIGQDISRISPVIRSIVGIDFQQI